MKKPFVLVGTFAEEIGMHGAHLLMASKAVKAKMAIIGEPSELQIVYANNGYMILDFDLPFSAEEKNIKRNQINPARRRQPKKKFFTARQHTPAPLI